jgi:hypothetical protein
LILTAPDQAGFQPAGPRSAVRAGGFRLTARTRFNTIDSMEPAGNRLFATVRKDLDDLTAFLSAVFKKFGIAP